ncbi:MAG: ATP-binding cassette domain-containing protein, partial [Verrucomicrobiota bacterium]|nr:ATP-binding cassette domain-containing protein [Verrucomicrobiota bacterium]
MSSELLRVENLRTYFHTRAGTIRAVDGISFSINAGETLGIVGESGSGKSVACLSVLGLMPSARGGIDRGDVW